MSTLLLILFGSLPMPAQDDPFYAERHHMVGSQIEARGVRDKAVLSAMRNVPRHRFIPSSLRAQAYGDHPLPIGHGQTISQPYIVAAMTELLELNPSDRVLEIGTGSGYQAAVLAEIVASVYTMEIVEPLGRRAAKDLARAGYNRVHCRIGNGYLGWPEAAPFDAIVVTAAPDEVPQALLDQLKPGGRLVVPVGPVHTIQYLTLIEKNKDGSIHRREVMPVRFVPMTGETARRPQE